MRFYVYTLAYPDGKVFYVGHGQGDRMHKHEYEARSGKTSNPHKVAVIRKIWAGGGEVVKEKVFETDDEREAIEMEIEWIAYIGRPNLTNLTDGGEGMSGYTYTQKHKENLSSSLLKHYWGEDIDVATRRELSKERSVDNWVRSLRRLEKEREAGRTPAFDRYSKNKMFPTYWEEPEYHNEDEYGLMDLDEFLNSCENVY